MMGLLSKIEIILTIDPELAYDDQGQPYYQPILRVCGHRVELSKQYHAPDYGLPGKPAEALREAENEVGLLLTRLLEMAKEMR